MLKTLIAIIAVLIIAYRIITAIDYWIGIPIWFYKVEAYFSYVLSLFFLTMSIIKKGEDINIIFIILTIYCIIQSVMDYIDYKYEKENQNENEKEGE